MSWQSSLSDNHRRTVCRIVFLILCALPTSFAIYSIVHQPGPAEWESRIWAQLGIRVDIVSVETPVPNKTVLRGVTVTRAALGEDFGAEEELLIDEIQILAGERTNTVTIAQPFEVNTDALTKVLERCTSQIEQADIGDQIWRFEFGKISLTDKQGVAADFVMEPAVLEVGCYEDPDQAGSSSICAALLSSLPDFETGRRIDDPANNLLVEYRKQPDGSQLRIGTGTGAIPCHLFRHWQDEVSRLGNRSVFTGIIDLLLSNQNDVSGSITGRIARVELDRVSEPFSLGARGSCSISIHPCQIRDNKIEFAKVQFDSRQPVTTRGSLLKAARGLGIRLAGEVHSETNFTLPYVSIAATIELGQLTLSGVENSTIAWDVLGNSLVECEDRANIPIQALAAFMTGEPPFGNQSLELLNLFKMPEPERTVRNPVDQTQHY